MVKSPIAKQVPHMHQMHGDEREDAYYWLKDRTNHEVITYLEQENDYYNHVMKPLKNLTDDLYEKMLERIPETEMDVPIQRGNYFYIKSYSPYDNVEAKEYPHLYVTTGLNDPRVAYWEPAKWVARLRALKTDNNKNEHGCGHYGASGRFNQLKESAESYAFILDKIRGNLQ